MAITPKSGLWSKSSPLQSGLFVLGMFNYPDTIKLTFNCNIIFNW